MFHISSNCIQSLTFFSLNNINYDTVNFSTKAKYRRRDSMQRKKSMFMTTHILTMKQLSTAHKLKEKFCSM